MNLWVDDLRLPPEGWEWAKTSDEAIKALEEVMVLCREKSAIYNFEVMSLDHDLGGLDTTRRVVLWCCENDFWPLEVRVHTQNPVGHEWLTGMIERYKP